ncbi:hypothetical protein IGI04_001172 [Brassica rapa subsp. trilocularis]|uniref:Uncharacterized protein n=1 Tax=Brassica rapa subsp. trilocularis TaxID=1813537 RepID=A0ABQ7NU50_BRACM|nr:hypothetical protein IGI04_001172 [Brassica rapa subsp. trilocularis]
MAFYRGLLPQTIHLQPLMKPQTLGLDASPNESVPIQTVKKTKEFKLNPEANNFGLSHTKRLSPAPTAMPDIGNIVYVPSNNPILPVPEAFYPELVNNQPLYAPNISIFQVCSIWKEI